MSNLVTIQRVKNNFLAVFDDGSKVTCVPTGNGIWLPVGGGNTPPPPGEFRWPFPRSTWNFTSYYGHSGIDRSGGAGDSVKAIGPGIVKDVYAFSGNVYPDFSEPNWRGNCVVINHGTINGINISSLYAHMLNTPLVSEGDTIVGGQVLGAVGNSGASNGAHLHLEVIFNNNRLPTSAPNQTSVGRGFTRTLNWMDDNTDGSSW